MAEKKQDFVVSDRRRFGTEGELRPDVTPNAEEKSENTAPVPPPVEETKASAPAASEPTAADTSQPAATESEAEGEEEMPEPPSATEVQEQKDAYHASGRKIDDLIGKSGGRATLPEMNFERLIESFYMTALLQLGAIRQEGETPGVDIMGARQTIDSLTILQEKTKGNLTDREQTLLQNVLFELRMAWIEITNAVASAKPGAGPGAVHEKQ
jgi:Domain of unknown function (DUF1844)